MLRLLLQGGSSKAALCPLSCFLCTLMTLVLQQMSVQGRWLVRALNFKVSFMLYADDLCLLSNDPDQLQRMLDKLVFMPPGKIWL